MEFLNITFTLIIRSISVIVKYMTSPSDYEGLRFELKQNNNCENDLYDRTFSVSNCTKTESFLASFQFVKYLNNILYNINIVVYRIFKF